MLVRWLRWVLTAALLTTTVGCTGDERDCVAPVAGTIAYTGGSVPPPFHVEWTVRLDGDRGRFEVTPGYGSAQHWGADFRPEAGAAAAACTQVVRAEQEDAPPPGSAVIVADLRDGSGQHVRRRAVATSSGDLYPAVRAAVPEATWTEVYGAYERWSDRQ